ncbi:MAG: sensor domain-containing diguanylate cyclase [Phycisphaerales bacterium]
MFVWVDIYVDVGSDGPEPDRLCHQKIPIALRMDTLLLDDILSCPTLPSLPSVAIRVLELTSDPEVEMEELAKEIQYDQAIAAKILRTVNSSFFGLRRRCSSIEHALVMLGLGPVKSLVLGFSLVSTVKGEDGDEFDYQGYWKRSLTTAVAAKYVAEQVENKTIVDEVFLVGLFQDIGMIAMHRTLGDDYLKIMRETGGVHSKLAKLELDTFEIQHSTVGAMICEKWKMPYEITIPVRYHDRATACPSDHGQVARCVAMGNLVHDVLGSDEPTEALRIAYRRGASWLGLSESQIDAVIQDAGKSTKELASLFSVDVGSVEDPEAVLAKADRQLIEMARNQQIEGYAAKQFAELVLSEDGTDPLTGVMMREGFAQAIKEAFPAAHTGQHSLSVVQVIIEPLDEIASSVGEVAQDEVVISTTMMLRKHFEPMGGVVCRLADSIFSVVLPAVERADAIRQANHCCEEFTARIGSWLPDTPNIEGLVTIAMGVATIDDSSRGILKNADLLVKAASQAVMAAKSADGSVARAFVPRNQAA